PFNPTTKITYQILELSFVTLKVYDVLGNEIEILVNEEKLAGSYEVEFEGEGLPSGVYFCRIKAGDFVKTMKMVLLK
ncbi:MAG: T9SS type A sorting domain-containing protein, partial [Ignavibacteriaceae bacterium]|nr:T9SS type A sorting domain-containing protein [Ignavibacteriaceae bacterium]